MSPDRSRTSSDLPLPIGIIVVKYFTCLILLLCTQQIPLQAEETPQLNKSALKPRKIVLIAGPKSHGPVGNGIHDYPWSVKLIKVMLDNSNVKDHVRVEYHLNGWPKNPDTLNDAHTIMVVSDGRDGDKYDEAPHFINEKHLKNIQRQIERGCGFLTFHFSTFAPDKYSKQILDWSGGYFDWEENGQRKWYSAIKTIQAPVQLPNPGHEICRGIKPFELREEFYFNIRFQSTDQNLTPLLEVPQLNGRNENGNVVAWAKERSNGGRGFGTTCGHFYANWQNDSFRKFILNSIVWTTGLEVPQQGVNARYYTHAEITSALSGIAGTESAIFDERPIRVLMFAGNEAHTWHNWKKTTPAIKKLLEHDPRIKVDVSYEIEDLSKVSLKDYQVIVQNYTNWHDSTPLSNTSRTAFMNYLQNGGGLILVHFANGAFHFSLPKAGNSDWPEYRKIVRRVWNHHGTGDAKSGHDAFGDFEVKITDNTNPLTRNLTHFPITDELYFRQDGIEPVEPLLSAKSKVTNKNEPLAWTYHYGKGRIFQTLLGHSEKTYDSFEACEVLRRATAWAANRPIHESKRPKVSPRKLKQDAILLPGKHGNALNTRTGSVLIPFQSTHSYRPLSVDCWVKLDQKDGFNIILASQKKSSPAHWEMYSYAKSGYFSVYLPGQGGEYKTKIDICDQKWHYVGMILEKKRIRLFVDGKQELDSKLPERTKSTPLGNTRIGGLVENTIQCHGLIDEVRVSKDFRNLGVVPKNPSKTDHQTLHLFSFDELNKNRSIQDAASGTSLKIEFPKPRTQKSTSIKIKKPVTKDHWGKESVGFSQSVQATDDGRWQQTKIGQWLACIVPLPSGTVKKGLSIRVGEHEEGTICYDTQHCKVRGFWTGGFLKPSSTRFGLIKPPVPEGKIHFATQEGPGWSADHKCQFLGSHIHKNRVTLEYKLDSTIIHESPWLIQSKESSCFTRHFEIGPGPETLNLNVADTNLLNTIKVNSIGFELNHNDNPLLIGAVGWKDIQTIVNKNHDSQIASFVIPPRKETKRFTIYYQTDPKQHSAMNTSKSLLAPASLQEYLVPGPERWNETLTTQGKISTEQGAYVVDTIAIPHKNPYKALFFISGHDFLENGDLAVSTVHGDVWLVSGIDGDLKNIKWKRFATGLFQPLGLKVVENQIYVLGRDQITILHDRNSDGEADFYECFNNMHPTSANGHDYVTCLETDSFGNFYFMHAQKGVMQITRDGRQLNIIASGLRNPNGMGIGPGNTITTSPQEGEWTPASNITEIKPGGYYGYGGPKVTQNRPSGYDPPLCWIPRLQDNSSGGQVWVNSDRWGPLKGQLLHLSYGQSKLLLTLREVINDQAQGGTLELPLDFESGIMRARFSPSDGQLYVSGMKGWVTNAVQDGCLQRVRYTNKPVHLPIEVKTMQNGIALTFTNPLDRKTAENPDFYAIEQWNYLWSKNYGSPEFRVSTPNIQGRDEVEVLSATLMQDQRTVFLELASVEPVMQMGITYHLNSLAGVKIQHTYYHTINSVSNQKMAPEILTRVKRTQRLTLEQQQNLKPGVLWKFDQNPTPGSPVTDARASRMFALAVTPGEPATPFLKPGQFTAIAEGFIHVPLTGNYKLKLEGFGTAKIKVNQKLTMRGSGGNLSAIAESSTKLMKGLNRIRIEYQSQEDGVAEFRLLWSGENFAFESIPPGILSHSGNDKQLLEMQQLRLGRELLANFQCLACHSVSNANQIIDPNTSSLSMPDLKRTAPSLANIGNRVSKRWLFHWMLKPHSLSESSKMPQLLGDPGSKLTKQKAADLTAWFISKAEKPTDNRSLRSNSDLDIDLELLIDAGSKLYEELGCINCHHFALDSQADRYDRTSLALIKRKYSPTQLIRFLQAPHQYNQWAQMPDFKLKQQEAIELSAFLIDRSQGKIPNSILVPTGSASRGHTLYHETLACVRCHDVSAKREPEVSQTNKIVLTRQTQLKGCLDESNNNDKVPHFKISNKQREAIQAILDHGTKSLTQRSSTEVAARWMHQLKCAACHNHDATSSPRGEIAAEEGSSGLLPEPLPSLTWAGEKLKTSWSKSFIAGNLSWKPRPWLKSRMPHFPANAQLLASGMAAQHGILAYSDQKNTTKTPLSSSQHIILGNQLTMKNALDCRQCHGVGNDLPTGDNKTKIALGINFVHIKERLNEDYYRRFVLDPPRFDMATKMPKLSIDGKSTKLTRYLEGNANQQFHAIWQFIQSLDEHPRSFSRN